MQERRSRDRIATYSREEVKGRGEKGKKKGEKGKLEGRGKKGKTEEGIGEHVTVDEKE